jgi:hypothetical protein
MSWLLFPSSGNHVTLDPEWNFDRSDKKIEDEHRTRSGRRYVYKWGSHARWKFDVQYVSSSTAAIVNSWFLSNASLLFMESGGTEIFSVQITNADLPFGRFVKPYTSLMLGTIELSTY